MSTYACEELSTICRRMSEIAKSEKRRDDNWRTASGDDLTYIGQCMGVGRNGVESDYSLRERMKAKFGVF